MNEKSDSTREILSNLQKETKPMPIHIGAGIGVACAITDAVTFPLYARRLLFQTDNKMGLKDIINNPRLLYRGLTSYCAGSFPSFIVQQGSLTAFNYFFPQTTSGSLQTCSAAMGGAISAFVNAPVNNLILCQQRLDSNKHSGGPIPSTIQSVHIKTSPREAFMWLYNQGGLLRMQRGLFPTMVRDGIYTTCTFSLANGVKQTLIFHFNMTDNFATSLFASVMTGGLGSIASQIPDVVATKMQNKDVPAVSARKILVETWKRHGVFGLFAGSQARMLSICLSTAGIIEVRQSLTSLWEARSSKENNPRPR